MDTCAPPLRPISDDEIARFASDGVVPIRGVFATEWLDLLRAGLARHLDAPTERSRIWDRDALGRTMFWDAMAWQGVPEYERFVRHSPAAAIAAAVLESERIRYFFDAVFVRSPGSQFRTPWHQDEPYWSVEGAQTCTVWMPLVPVRAEHALAFVPGSHLGTTVFDQYDFGSLNPDEKGAVDRSDFSAIAEGEIPHIFAEPDRYGVVSWDLEPRDCVVFNSRILHGGSGLLPENCGLEVFTSKWLGDDVRICFRDVGMDPDFSGIMRAHGLGDGDRPGTELLPEVRVG